MMGKIIFYENKNFGGGHHECMGDCADLQAAFNQCQSIRVESGMFVVYDRPNFTGHQHFLRKGEYCDSVSMLGMNNSVKSCRIVPMHRSNFQMRLYENSDMGGQMMDLDNDCPNCMDRFRMSMFNSCNVIDGHWLMYDQANYRGRHYYLRPGEYRRYSDWGAMSSKVGSIRRIMDL